MLISKTRICAGEQSKRRKFQDDKHSVKVRKWPGIANFGFEEKVIYNEAYSKSSTENERAGEHRYSPGQFPRK